MVLNIHLKDNNPAGDLKALSTSVRYGSLFTTSAHPCPPPIPLAMECQPVLLAVCGISRGASPVGQAGSSTVSAPFDKNGCLASVREQLQ